MASNETAIRLHDVGLALSNGERTVQVLTDINLEVAAGEKIALVGPSGSGKTSLLTLVAGLQPPTAGSVSILGRPIDGTSEDDLARLRGANIGIVFQSFHLIPTMTALENVAIPMELANKGGAEATARESLEAVGMAHRLDHYPHQLSGGEQQRVAIARAFTNRPRILLADEPTGNLDVDTGKRVVETLLGLVDANKTTLIFITHDASLLEPFDRVVRIRDGRINGA